MRRVMSLFLPCLPTDRLRRPHRPAGQDRAGDRPLVTASELNGRRIVAALNPPAEAAGIAPGLPLADARAFLPSLEVAEHDPAADAALLARLAEWCGRFSPWVAVDGADGIVLDVTGCAHLFGGEAGLAHEVAARVTRLGFAARVAIADTAGAAWGLARFGDEAVSVTPSGGSRDALASLPVAALRLDRETGMGLTRLGLARVGDLYAMPRAALVRRFGETLARLLDHALGEDRPISPLRERPARQSRLAFAEPLVERAGIEGATGRLVAGLCRTLAAEGAGARRLELACYRVDGETQRIAIGTARPSREPRHLTRLLAEKLDTIDPGLGIELMVLTAPVADPLAAAQLRLKTSSSLRLKDAAVSSPPPLAGEGRVEARRGRTPLVQNLPPAAPSQPSPASGGGESFHVPIPANDRATPVPPRVAPSAKEEMLELGPLLDRLGSRIGFKNLRRLAPFESHVPERAQTLVPASEDVTVSWPAGRARPIRLLAPPEPIEAVALVPDDPPLTFRWRRMLHRVARADGPERIGAEWWRQSGDPRASHAIRDYYRVEDAEGRRFWLFRAGLHQPDAPARWYLHGVFA